MKRLVDYEESVYPVYLAIFMAIQVLIAAH